MSRQSKNAKNLAKAKQVTIQHNMGQAAGPITNKGKGKGKNAAKRQNRGTIPKK